MNKFITGLYLELLSKVKDKLRNLVSLLGLVFSTILLMRLSLLETAFFNSLILQEVVDLRSNLLLVKLMQGNCRKVKVMNLIRGGSICKFL